MRFLRSNTAVLVTVGPFFDKTDGVTIETALTITNERITLTADTDAGSAPTNILDNVTGATSGTSNDLNYITGNDAGMMQLELAAADVNRVGRMFLSITDAANHVPVFHEFFVLPQAIYDWLTGAIVPLPANVTTWLGTAAATPTVAGVPEVDVTHWIGTAAAAPTVAGVPEVDVTHWIGTAAATPTVPGVPEVDLTHVAGATTNVAALATNVDAILTDTGTTLDARIPAALVSGRMDASVGAMAANVITAAATAADFSTEVRSVASGTSDSGSTTTMVDAARTEADTDWWKGALIVFTSGTVAGQARVITAFDPATDTITFAPATTAAVSTQTYEIWPVGDFLRPTTSGRTLDVSTGGEAGLDWANIGSPTTAQNLSATNIDVDQVVASVSGAVGSVTGAVGSVTGLTAATVHSDLDDIQAKIGTPAGASVSADIAAIEAQTDDIGVAGAGLTAVPWNAAWDAEVQSEVDDAINTAISELGVATPTATPTIRTALMLMYMALRNKLVVQTSGTDAIEIYNDAGTKIASKTITDDGADYTEDEMV